ncbi:MAG: hypothetical protein KAS38_05700, partial [Anaerolineales bacterium]|nr:hypothetical protein [Anaerolineales bacterium]
GGPKIVTEETKYEMNQMLKDIQDGTYANAWIEENEKGRPWFNEQRRKEQDHPIEKVGAGLREMMPFIDPVEIKPGD